MTLIPLFKDWRMIIVTDAEIRVLDAVLVADILVRNTDHGLRALVINNLPYRVDATHWIKLLYEILRARETPSSVRMAALDSIRDIQGDKPGADWFAYADEMIPDELVASIMEGEFHKNVMPLAIGAVTNPKHRLKVGWAFIRHEDPALQCAAAQLIDDLISEKELIELVADSRIHRDVRSLLIDLCSYNDD